MLVQFEREHDLQEKHYGYHPIHFFWSMNCLINLVSTVHPHTSLIEMSWSPVSAQMKWAVDQPQLKWAWGGDPALRFSSRELLSLNCHTPIAYAWDKEQIVAASKKQQENFWRYNGISWYGIP